MLSKHPISQSKSYSIFVSLVISVLLLSSCSPTVSISSTPTPPSPISLVAQATPTSNSSLEPTLPSSTPQVLLNTPTPTLTPIPPSPTPQVLLDTATPSLSATLPTATTAPAGGNIVFNTGTTAALVGGTIQPGKIVTYTIQANQSQPMILIMGSPNNDVTLGVFQPNGATLLNPTSKRTKWQAALPVTGLYTIQVIGGATLETYSLTIKVAQLVNFASGANSITLNGTMVNGYIFDYALGASAGQTLTATLNVPSSTAVLDIFGVATGQMLLDASAQANTWSGVLPDTQGYVVEVVSTNGQGVSYSLTVSITGAPVNTASSAGGNIVFDTGTTAAELRGTVQPGQMLTYTIQANQFQPMILILESLKNDLTLGVLEPDGTTLLSPAKKWSRWQWMLPVTGLYTIRVIGSKTTEDYILTVKVAKLVNFPSGSTSITIYGTTHNGYVLSYAFRLSAGSIMTASLDVPSSKAYLDIFGVEHGSLLNYSEKANNWNGTLPYTDEYVVEVIPRGGYLTSFALTVSVP